MQLCQAKYVTAFGSVTIPNKKIEAGLNLVSPDLTVTCIQFEAGPAVRLTCNIAGQHDYRMRIFCEQGVPGINDTWDYRASIWTQRYVSIRRRMLLAPWKRKLRLFEKVIQMAALIRLFCMEAMWMRFVPAYREFISKSRNCQVGEPTALYADFGVPTSLPKGHHQLHDTSGGAWMDRGVYGLSLAIDVFGKPEKIQSDAILGPTGCDVHSIAILTFPHNRMATISCSFLAYSSNKANLAGTRGRIRLREPSIRADAMGFKAFSTLTRSQLCHSQKGRKDRLRKNSILRNLKSKLAPERTYRVPFTGNGYIHEFEEAASCIADGRLESPKMPLQHSLLALQISQQIRKQWLADKNS